MKEPCLQAGRKSIRVGDGPGRHPGAVKPAFPDIGKMPGPPVARPEIVALMTGQSRERALAGHSRGAGAPRMISPSRYFVLPDAGNFPTKGKPDNGALSMTRGSKQSHGVA